MSTKQTQNKYPKQTRNFWFSFGLVLLFSFGLMGFSRAAGASLYLSPYSGTFFAGSTFNVSVFLDTEGNSINAVQVDLKFPPELLQVTSPTAGESFISVWADQPFFSNKEGLISFKGGVLAPGIETSAGLVSTITFRAKALGVANISFLDSSKVLLADGKGTNILKTTMTGEYILVVPPPEGPKVFSATHPSHTRWYRDNNPVFSWEKEVGVTDFSYSLDQDSTGVPDNVSEGDQTSTTFNGIADGVWYFHIKAKKGGAWGRPTHYPLHIDSTSPRKFQIDIRAVSRFTGARFFAYFSTDDLLSGVEHYEISVVDMSDPQAAANPFFVETVSPYKILYEGPGKYMVLVRAYDEAGNFSQEESVLTIVTPFISYTEKGIRTGGLFLPFWVIYSLILLIIIFLSFGIYSLLRRKNLRRRLKKEVAEAEKEIGDVEKLEERIREMRTLEEEAGMAAERLAERLKPKDLEDDTTIKEKNENR